MLLLWQLQLSLIQAVGYNTMWLGCCNVFFILGIMVRFRQGRFTGSEVTGVVVVNLELIGGSSANPFNVMVTPSEQSPMSAQGNSVMCVLLCVDWRVFD